MNKNHNPVGFQQKADVDAEGRKQPVLVQQLTVRPVHRKSQDIGAWRNAIRAAEALNPRRTELYDLYEDIMLDGHLWCEIEKRIQAVTNAEWQFLTADGQELEFMKDWIDSPDFEEVLEEIAKSKAWGYTMIDFEFYPDGSWGIYTIPRKHMRPELGMVTYEQTGQTGINVREGVYADTVLEVGKENDLGILKVVAQYVIYKRGNFGDWAQFAEVFGMPLIDAVWDGYDENQRVLLLEALENMGSGGQLVRPAGTELTFIQGGANNPTGDLYNNLIKACNAEISKTVLGQTETTESSDSSGYAQSETHADVVSGYAKSDRKYVRRILNRRLVKILEANGIDLAGGSFSIKGESEKPMSKAEQLINDIRLKNEVGLPMSDDYFYETYGVERPDDYEAQKEAQKEAATVQPYSGGYNLKHPHPSHNELKILSQLKRFFGIAPGKSVGADINIQLKEFYQATDCCDHTSHTIQLSESGDPFNDDFVKKVFEGELKDGQVHDGYYFDVANKLTKAVEKGLGGNIFNANDYRNTLKAHLEHNLYAFSAAKSMTALQQYRNALTNDEGKLESFGKFRQKVTEVDVEFNNTYLETEYNSAVAMSQMADKWEGLQEHEYLEYRTVGDNRVRKEHAELDGMVFAKDDAIWDKIYPPNDWNCRCTVLPAAPGAEPTPYKQAGASIKQAKIKPYFNRNVGKSKTIFKDEHPYFQKMEQDGWGKPGELSATKHYNMPEVNKIYEKVEKLPQLQALASREEAVKWFKKNAPEGVLQVQSKDGLNIELDKSFYGKIVDPAKDKYKDRFSYAHKAPEVMQEPDEIWSHYHKGELQTTYIKYYQDKPYMVAVKDNKGKLEFESFYKVDSDSAISAKRMGVLKFRK